VPGVADAGNDEAAGFVSAVALWSLVVRPRPILLLSEPASSVLDLFDFRTN